MSTQKKDSAKGQARNTGDTQTQKGKGADGQPKPGAKTTGSNDRKPTNGLGNDSKRPAMSGKKN